MKSFFVRLRETCEKKGSLLCVGLDPRIESDKAAGHPGRSSVTEALDEELINGILEANRRIIESTLPYAACYKPNIAFYEAAGPSGLVALERTLSLIPEDTPVILDAKRSDIGSTAAAYAKAIFGHFGANAVTLNPYMGRDAVEPFLAYEDRGIFMLCRTSNPGAGVVQELRVSGEQLYLKVAETCVSWGDAVGLVVAGNEPSVLREIRERFPSVWLLAPGIGAQGGDAVEAVSAGRDADGFGILPVVARGISAQDDPGRAAREYRDLINEGRRKIYGGAERHIGSKRREILSGLIDTGCFRIGEFVLKSGKVSPFYIDLRRVISSPPLLSLVADAYAEVLSGLAVDRIAAIPVAALPFGAAVSLRTGIPLIFPRMTAKDHGTGNVIEGDYKPGERVVLLDDLITTGKSKLEAAEILRSQGLVVNDLAVLLERGAQGRKDMDGANIALRSYADISDLLVLCEEKGLIDRESRDSMIEYARRE